LLKSARKASQKVLLRRRRPRVGSEKKMSRLREGKGRKKKMEEKGESAFSSLP